MMAELDPATREIKILAAERQLAETRTAPDVFAWAVLNFACIIRHVILPSGRLGRG